jgi:hypothetical protein
MSETTAVLGNFSITLPAPNGAQLSISGYIYADESKASLDERIDVCRQSMVRQQKILEIPVLEEKMKMLESTKSDIMAAYADLLEKQKKTPKSLPSQEASNLRNYPTQIKTIDRELEKARVAIEQASKAG